MKCECEHQDGGVLCEHCVGMVKRLVEIDRIKAGAGGAWRHISVQNDPPPNGPNFGSRKPTSTVGSYPADV